jgi:2-oxo-4-hydroxy-4-carboxy-5-ureidoimidazoline decarboxylase
MDAQRRVDALPEAEARAAFERCCGARRWVQAMTAGRPYGDAAALRRASDAALALLTPDDWREAFSHHPRIGDREALRAKFAATRSWAAGEQAGVDAAGDDVLDALALANREYEDQFGYIFIVCASGKSALEMLRLLRERLRNDPQRELGVAAGEQAKITRLRLDKLLSEGV